MNTTGPQAQPGPLGLNQADFSIALPQTREDVTKLYTVSSPATLDLNSKTGMLTQRWQELRALLGDQAQTNPEFVELSRVLKAFSRQQELLRQQKMQRSNGK